MGVALASAQHHRREGLVAVAPVMQQSRGDALQVRADGTHHVAAERHRPGIIVAIEQKALDRKSVVSGKGVSVRVDLGGRRLIQNNTHTTARSSSATATEENV